MPNPPSFLLRPSKRQQRLDGAFVLISLLLLAPFIGWLGLFVSLALAVLIYCWQHTTQTLAGRLCWQDGQWWLVGVIPQLLLWRVGSVRRRDLIIWRYGRWPWQRLHIRPDNLAAGQFQQLLRELALKPL